MASSADPHDPQFAEIAFLLTTIPVGIAQSPINGFRCRPYRRFRPPIKPLAKFKTFFLLRRALNPRVTRGIVLLLIDILRRFLGVGSVYTGNRLEADYQSILPFFYI